MTNLLEFHNSSVSFEISTTATVVWFQYAARRSGHSFVDVTKFHLQFQSLDFSLPSPLDFNHNCRSLIQHVAVAKRRFMWRSLSSICIFTLGLPSQIIMSFKFSLEHPCPCLMVVGCYGASPNAFGLHASVIDLDFRRP